MDFSTDQAKSIFALIKEVSPYAYPLLLSLLIPIVWVALKKLLGIEKKETTALADTPKKNIFSSVISYIGSAISLKGDRADRLVFHACIAMFLLGGILLKVGENREEMIRQETLALKQYFFSRGYIWVKMEDIIKQGYPESDLKTIARNFPDDFLIADDYITCVDTGIVQKTYRFTMPLSIPILVVTSTPKKTLSAWKNCSCPTARKTSATIFLRISCIPIWGFLKTKTATSCSS